MNALKVFACLVLLVSSLWGACTDAGHAGICYVGSGQTYATPAACAAVVTAGQTCQFQDSGTYAGWTQYSSGTVGNPIVFNAANGQSPTISSQVYLSNVNYVQLVGNATSGLTGGIQFTGTFTSNYAIVLTGNGSTTGTHLILKNLVLNYSGSGTSTLGNVVHVGSGSYISNSQFINIQVNRGASSGLDKGSAPCFLGQGENNLFDGNACLNGAGDNLDWIGAKNVVRNNQYIGPNPNGNGYHLDFVQGGSSTTTSLTQSLVENNTESGCTDPTYNCHFFINQTYTAAGAPTSDGMIIRYNTGSSINGAAFLLGGGQNTPGPDNIINSWFYNNTMDTGALRTCGYTTGLLLLGGTLANINATALNNLFANISQGSTSCTPFGVQNGTLTNNGNLMWTSGYSGDWHSPYTTEATYPTLHSKDPNFVSAPSDLNLQSPSVAIAGGVKLTTVAAGGCSGNTVSLTDSHPFQDGWGPNDAPVNPDWIRIGATNHYQLAQGGNNYSTGVVTLQSTPTCSAGDPVYLYADSNGTTVLTGALPDVGSKPFASNPPFTLTVSVEGNATGYITGTDGIDCGTTPGHTACTASHNSGDKPVYTQNTSTGAFVKWGGSLATAGSCTTGNTCSPTFPSDNETLSATFNLVPTCTLSLSQNSVNIGETITGTSTAANIPNQSGSAFTYLDPLNVIIYAAQYPFSGGCSNTGCSVTLPYTVSGVYQFVASFNGLTCTAATSPLNINSPNAGPTAR